ncbi:MAG TPA: HupE/UreJ family protein [Kofleriaceae bacterium]|nr:HupE/UreJ family protein [Kofleriaceae bacterium]
MRAVAITAAVALALAVAAPVAAHPLGPSSLQLDEHAPGRATARFQTPAAANLSPRWPAGCAAARRAGAVDGDVRVEHFELDCHGRPLAGAEVGVDGLAARDAIAIVRVRLAGGRVAHDVLGPAHPRVTIPAEPAWTQVVLAHGRLGVEHLLDGLDHLLFVLGLLLVVSGLRARAVTLTAFTAGHSVTLALAALGVVHVPAAPVEILIAITLIVVALQALEPPPLPGAPRRPAWLLAAGFGLIHGLGFAGALTGAGLPADDLALALAGFNLGIEVGQLALVAAAMLVAALVGRGFRGATRWGPRARIAAAYTIGGLAAMWCLERTWTAFSP